MIKIHKIEINNYRSCLNTSIDVQDDLTTLIGINGVGKSNILNSLQLLKKINRNRFFHQQVIQETLKHSCLKINLSIESSIYLFKADIYLETDESNLDEIYNAEIQFRRAEDKNKRWFTIDVDLFAYVERLKFINKPINDKKIQDTYLKSEEGQIAIKIVSYLNGISYYSATQFSDPTRCPVSIELEEMSRVGSFRNRDIHGKFIFDLYTSFKNEKTSFAKFLNTINKNGIGLVDDIAFFEHSMLSSSYIVKSVSKINQIEKNKNIVIPSVTIDGIVLSPNQLSEGTLKTLALVFYILHDKNDLLLIEEPEVCVHHGLLSSIIELIKLQAKEKQIIISTHSDFVLDKLQPENIILVNKNKQKGTIAKHLSKAMSKNDYSALKEYLKTSGNLGEYWKEGGFENE
jgi:predicted ATP-dependent endonuclease of OLD family